MRTLVLGGARSGKSAYAESLLAGAAPVRYVATAWPVDEEMAERIRRHRERRPPTWELVEVAENLEPALSGLPEEGHLFIDGLTLWLASVLETVDDVPGRVRAAVDRIARLSNVVIVSEEVGGGIVPAHAAARRFRDLAGELNQRVAEVCDRVVLVTAGLPLELKRPGMPPSATLPSF